MIFVISMLHPGNIIRIAKMLPLRKEVTSVPEYRFLASILSMMPHSLYDTYLPLDGSADRVCGRLLMLGIEGFQTGPIRGVKGHEWFCSPEWSLYKEGTWNGVYGFWQAATHQWGEAMEPSTLADYVVFPDPWEAERVFKRLAGRHVSHDFGGDPDLLTEIKPEHKVISTREMVLIAEAGNYDMVLDTQHALRDHRKRRGYSPFGQTLRDRIAAVDEYAHLVRAFHMKGDGDADQALIKRFLRCPNLQPRIDVILEPIPNLGDSEDRAIYKMDRLLKSAKRLFVA